MISCAGVTGSVGITCHDQLCWGDWECGYYMSCVCKLVSKLFALLKFTDLGQIVFSR